MKEGKEDTKKRCGTRSTALEFIHNSMSLFYLLKIQNHSTPCKLQKMSRRFKRSEMSLIISWYILPQITVNPSSKYSYILRERHLYSCLSLIFHHKSNDISSYVFDWLSPFVYFSFLIYQCIYIYMYIISVLYISHIIHM